MFEAAENTELTHCEYAITEGPGTLISYGVMYEMDEIKETDFEAFLAGQTVILRPTNKNCETGK